jgi:hypothetical protein
LAEVKARQIKIKQIKARQDKRRQDKRSEVEGLPGGKKSRRSKKKGASARFALAQQETSVTLVNILRS